MTKSKYLKSGSDPSHEPSSSNPAVPVRGQTPAAIDGPASFQAHFEVSDATIAKLEAYAEILTKWQKTINLVAPKTLPEIWHRHFADSAQLLAHGPPLTKRWLDLGSGAGFPGLVIAIMVNDTGYKAANPGPVHITLIESDLRKCAFLREAARHTGAVVDIVGGRIESPATQSKVGLQDVVSARALAPLSELFSYPGAFLGPDTVCLFLKGRDADREVREARAAWSFKADLQPSLTDPAGRIVIVSELQAQCRSSVVGC